MIYLDYAAATPLDPQVALSMQKAKKLFANPSSIYLAGRQAHEALEEARADIAQVLNCRASEIVFTSGGTESDNLAIAGIAHANKNLGNHLVSIATEHASNRIPLENLQASGFKLDYAQVDKFGAINLSSLEKIIKNETILVVISYASSEIGTIQPIAQISALITKIRANRVRSGNKTPLYLHCDASAAANLLPIRVDRLRVDTLSINAAKIYGPKGSGALYIRRGVDLQAQILGGGQENGRRAGTTSLSLAVGLATSLKISDKIRAKQSIEQKLLNNYLVTKLKANIEGIEFCGHPTKRLMNTTVIVLPDHSANEVVTYLDAAGIAVASGAACNAANDVPSPALIAIGLTKLQASRSIRISTGRETTNAQLDKFLSQLTKTLHKLDTIKS